MFQVDGPVNLVRLNQLVDLVDAAEVALAAVCARLAAQSRHTSSDMFEAMKQGDILLHHPFESFEPVIEFLRQSAVDPHVAAIRMTLYRTGISSVMVDILEEAARRGKEVTAIVELKARFDEEANINLAERLEAVGAQVVYGVLGLKTHGKMTAGVAARRRAADVRHLVRYAHLGTGNYHPATTKLYTDFGMLTDE